MKTSVPLLSLLLAACNSTSTPQTSADAAEAARSPGKQVFDHWCAPCHANGPHYAGTASLAVKYGKDLPAALEERRDLTPESVAHFVRHGVLNMPPFRKTEISDEELKALGAYLSHSEQN